MSQQFHHPAIFKCEIPPVRSHQFFDKWFPIQELDERTDQMAYGLARFIPWYGTYCQKYWNIIRSDCAQNVNPFLRRNPYFILRFVSSYLITNKNALS